MSSSDRRIWPTGAPAFVPRNRWRVLGVQTAGGTRCPRPTPPFAHRSRAQAETGPAAAAPAMPPPRLLINVDASTASLRPGALLGGGAAAAGDGGGNSAAAALHAPSIEIGPSGTLKLFKSLQAFEFNPLGMVRRDEVGAPLARGAAAMQTSYKVRGVRGARMVAGGSPPAPPSFSQPACAGAGSQAHCYAHASSTAAADLGARRAHRAHAGQRRQRRGAESLPAARVPLCGHQEDLGAGARQAAPGGGGLQRGRDCARGAGASSSKTSVHVAREPAS